MSADKDPAGGMQPAGKMIFCSDQAVPPGQKILGSRALLLPV